MPLFVERLRRLWQSYYTLWSYMFDITIVLYLTAFAALFLFYFARETIFQGHYGIFNDIPLSVILFVLLCMSSFFKWHNFSEQADSLFLMHTPTYTVLKRAATFYSLLLNSLYIALMTLITAIVLIGVHQLSWLDIGVIWLLLCAVHCMQQLLTIFIRRTWLRLCSQLALLMSVLFLYSYSTMTVIVLISSAIILYALYDRQVVQTNVFFQQLVIDEAELSLRWHTRLFNFNPDLRHLNMQYKNAKRPWTFKRLYSHTSTGALTEIFLKTLWRNRTYRLPYLQFLSIVFALIWLVPWWAGYLLIAFLVMGLFSYVDTLFTTLQEHRMFTVIHYDEAEWFAAKSRLKRWLALPIPIVYCLLVTINLLL